jgi:MFS family permease
VSGPGAPAPPPSGSGAPAPPPRSVGRAERYPQRWRVVTALLAVITCVASSLSAFGVFLPVLTEVFGWSRGAVSAALTVNMVVGGAVSFGLASIADRHGPRGVLAVTVLIGAGGFALMSRVAALWQLYLVYGVVVGAGASSIYVLSTATVSRWFTERRGLALAIVLSGFNLGWVVGGPIAAMLIDALGWRGAYVALGALIAVVGVPASLWVRYPDRPRGAAASRDGGAHGAGSGRGSFADALADRRLWLLSAAWLSMGLVFMTVTVHSVPFARDLGLSLDRASLVLTGYGLGASLGRLAGGVAADGIGAWATLRICVLAQAFALALLVAAPPAWAVAPVLVLFGIGAAGADSAFVKSVPEVFGLGALAMIISVLSFGWRLGAGIGPAGAGFLYDLTRSYTIPFVLCLMLLGVLIVLFSLGTRPAAARPPAR